MNRIFRCLSASVLGAGVLTTPLLLDSLAYQGFREPKMTALVFIGATAAVLWGGWNLSRSLKKEAPLWPPLSFGALIPAAILLWFHGSSADGESAFFSATLSGENLLRDYRLHVFLPVLAWFVCAGAAACVFSTPRLRRGLGLCFVGVLLAESSVVAYEILHRETGFQIPFLSFLAHLQISGSEVKKEIFGTLGNPNFVAGFLAVATPPAVGWFLGCRRRVPLLLGCLSVGLTLLCLVSTRSKGGLLSITFGTAHFLWAAWWTRPGSRGTERARGWKRRSAWVAAICLLCLVSLGVGWSLADRSAGQTEGSYLGRWKETLRLEGDSVTVRAFLAHVGFHMWQDHPWVGWGPGGFKVNFLESLRKLLEGESGSVLSSRVSRLHSLRANHLHNEYLQILVEWGLVGFLSVLLFLAVSQTMAVAGIRAASSASDRWMRIGLLSGVWSGLGGCFFDLPLHRPAQAMLLAVALGASLSIRLSIPRGKPHSERTTIPLRFLGFSTGAALLALGLWMLPQAAARYVAMRQVFFAKAALDGKIRDANAAKTLQAIRLANRLVPGEGDYAFLRARYLYEVDGDKAETVAQIRRIKGISEDPNLIYLEAKAQVDRGNDEAAQPLLSFLRVLNTETPGLHSLQAQVFQNRGLWAQAAAEYLEEIENWKAGGDPLTLDVARSYLQVATLFEDRLADFEDAAKYYRAFLDLQQGGTEGYPQAQLRLAAMLRDRFLDLDGAERHFQEALGILERLGIDQEVRKVRGEILEIQNRRQQSLWGS